MTVKQSHKPRRYAIFRCHLSMMIFAEICHTQSGPAGAPAVKSVEKYPDF